MRNRAEHGDFNDGHSHTRKPYRTRAANSRARTSRHPIRSTIGIVVLLVISLALGYSLGGVRAISKEVCPNDAKWDLDGTAPTSSLSDSVEPKGPALSTSEAGAYYLDAVEPSAKPFEDALTISFSGDLAATQKAAAKAAKALQATAQALRSRTWPESVTNAVTTIADNYATKAKQADYVASAIVDTASEELTQLDAYRASEADAYLRGKLGLPAAKAPTIPLEIVHIEDLGVQQGYDHSGSSLNKGKRVLDVTVRSHVPGTLTGLYLSFNLLQGKHTVGRAWGEVRDIRLAEGQSAVVTIALGDDNVSDSAADGDVSVGGAIAGSHMVWDALSITDVRGASRKAAIEANYSTANPDPVLDAFMLR